MKEEHLKIAEKTFLEQAELSESQLTHILNDVLTHSVDSADLYFQLAYAESWMLEDGIVKSASYNIDRGVGVRAISGEQVGFAYSDDIIFPAIAKAASAAKTIARTGGAQSICAFKRIQGLNLYSSVNPLDTFSESEKIALMRKADESARQCDLRVSQVIVSLAGSYSTILIVGSDGTYAADVRPLVRLNVNVIVEDKGCREQGVFGGGSRSGYDYFLKNNCAIEYSKEAVRQACVNLQAVEAPAGVMPVVLGHGWPGVLLHEAIGHGLEGDFNRKKTSAFTDRIGQRVASSLCTIIDDGTLVARRGSLNIDDEGVPTQRTVLIEKGILQGYMHDKMNARLMGVSSTGNGRRESYSYLPMPRMTNTFMLPGHHQVEEIISSIDKGLYAVNFGGGQVDITSGKFVFSASEAYLIESGKITSPVKGAMLIGNGPDVLTKVSMVADDLELDSGVGTCGKEGQSVPVGVGQPTLKIDELTVGGTGTD